MKIQARYLMFTVGFCIAYGIVYGLNLSILVYYPNLGEWHFIRPSPQPGLYPPMVWYGTVCVGVLGGLGLAVLIPPRRAIKLWALTWIAPLCLILFTFYHESHYFSAVHFW